METPLRNDDARAKISMRSGNVHYGANHALIDVDMDVFEHRVTALMGPSGCGKSTFLNSLNRMIEVIPGARFTGMLTMDGEDLMDRTLDVVEVRRRFGIVAQKPNPFPISIWNNVTYGPRIHGLIANRADEEEIAVTSLKKADLWEEVKDRLKEDAFGLSGGQQQRLCIARAISTRPEVVLMDEPCSAIDPIATAHIEDLIAELKREFTVIIVTHNLTQAHRVSAHTAFFHLGKLIEFGPTPEIFESAKEELTKDFVAGAYG